MDTKVNQFLEFKNDAPGEIAREPHIG
jgi:hypothetical protein